MNSTMNEYVPKRYDEWQDRYDELVNLFRMQCKFQLGLAENIYHLEAHQQELLFDAWARKIIDFEIDNSPDPDNHLYGDE